MQTPRVLRYSLKLVLCTQNPPQKIIFCETLQRERIKAYSQYPIAIAKETLLKAFCVASTLTDANIEDKYGFRLHSH